MYSFRVIDDTDARWSVFVMNFKRLTAFSMLDFAR